MAETSKNVAIGSAGFIVGAVVPVIISLGIFARTNDVSELKAQMYRDFVQREDMEKWVQRIDKKLEGIETKVEKIVEDRR